MAVTDVDVSLAALEQAVAIVQAGRGRPLIHLGKGGADFATEVDVTTEQAIVAVLHRERPGDAVQGEESGLSGPAGAARTWYVDPLCGTLNYASGGSAYAINIALTRDDDVVAAVVAEPATGATYVTDGRTAWVRRNRSDTPLAPSPSSALVEVHLDTADPDESGFSSSRFLRSSTFATLSPRYLATSLPLAWVASGQRAGFVIPGRRGASVHFTAGIGLCRAAGCVLSDLRGQPLHLANNGIVVAADPATHDLLLAGIAEQLAPT